MANFRLKRPGGPTEAQEQEAVCRWLDCRRHTYFAVLNDGAYRGGGFTRYESSRKIGWKKGVPDLVIVSPRSFGGKEIILPTFVEMKRATGSTVSPEQKAWIEVLSQWFPARVCYGARDAIEWLKGLGY